LGCVLGVLTQRRNHVWSSEESFWGDVCGHHPTKVRPWLNYGSALAEAGKWKESEQAYSKAIEIQPSGLAFANLALLQLRSEQPQKALETALQAAKCSSSGYDFFVLAVIGECYFRLQRWEEAASCLEGSLRTSPGFLTSIKLLGLACLNLNNAARARDVFLQGLAFHPDNPELRSALQHTLQELQKPSQAQPPPPKEAQEAPFKLKLGLGP
jgi:tetratricopeptide (TPR) repeat protein